MDPITTAASVSTALRNLATLVPPGGTNGARKRLRQDAYRAFEHAVHDAESWAADLRLLQQLKPDQVPVAILLDRSDSRTSAFMAAVADLRMLGNPRPRGAGEEIVCLLAALFDAIGPPPLNPLLRDVTPWLDSQPDQSARLRRIPWLAKNFDAIQAAGDEWQRASERFDDVRQALGRAHRRFILAARDDLSPARHWHFGGELRVRWWQFWRVPASWPGGFPPPDADALVERYRAEARDPAKQQELPPG